MISGKQRELQQRDELFLQVAQQLLLVEGYHGLTMARVAEQTRFSKGTVYNHFSCKEEIVVALGCRCRAMRLALLERAAAFEGRPRERMVALGEAAEHFERVYPDEMRVLSIISAEAIYEKVSDVLRAEMRSYEAQAFNLCVAVVKDAVASGDLQLSGRNSPQDISFALWCMFDSGAATLVAGFPCEETGLTDPYGAIGRGCHLLMDGCGWRPLQQEWDYSATARRVRETILPEEARMLQDRLTGGSAKVREASV